VRSASLVFCLSLRPPFHFGFLSLLNHLFRQAMEQVLWSCSLLGIRYIGLWQITHSVFGLWLELGFIL